MAKFQMKTEGLAGDSLTFVQKLNAAMADFGETFTPAELAEKMKEFATVTFKGMYNEKGVALDIDFAKLATIHDEVLGDGENSIKSVMKRQGDIITALKELQGDKPARVKSIRDQIRDMHEKQADNFKKFLTGDSKFFGTKLDDDGNTLGTPLDFKVAQTMTIANSSGGSNYVPNVEVVPGLVPLVRNRPFLEDFANTSSTNRSRIAFTEKFNVQGQAAWLGEGGVKPLVSWEWRTTTSYAKKVAAKTKVSTESLQDVDWMAAEIEAELKYQVDIAVDEGLLAGTGTGLAADDELKGLTSYAGGYVLTSITTTFPNDFDALRAARGQIVSLNFDPTHVFINPIDGANMDIVKDQQGRPLMMEYRDEKDRLFRLTPIETNQIPVGSYLMGDMSKFYVRNYIPFSIYYGWVNDDFEKNLVTVLGERRLHAYVYNNYTGAFIYDTFADTKTAITAP